MTDLVEPGDSVSAIAQLSGTWGRSECAGLVAVTADSRCCRHDRLGGSWLNIRVNIRVVKADGSDG